MTEGATAICDTCRFGLRTDETAALICKRHAPLVTGGLHGSVETVWPEVALDDWCGDHEPSAV